MSGWPGQKVGTMPAAQPAPQQGGPIAARPVFSVPNVDQMQDNARADATEARQAATSQFRLMTPEEVKALGLPVGGVYQINGAGEVKEVTAAPKTGTPESTAANAVVSAGIDLRAKDDRVAKLIMDSTSGGLETMGANAYGFVTGGSTDGMKAIGALKPLLADLVLQATGGSLGAQISDGDRKFIMERMGNIADPEVPADQRLASWNEVKRRLASSLGVPMNEVTFLGEDTPATTTQPQGRIPGVIDPEMVGDVPRGSQVELRGDKIGRDTISAGQRFLDELGIGPNDEARMTAFWNANRGNQSLTVDSVRQWYASNGYGPPSDEQIAATIEQANTPGTVFGGIDTAEMDERYIQQLDTMIEQQGIDPENMGRSAAAGAASGSTLGWNDEIMGGIAAVDELLQSGDVVGAYEANRDLRRRVRERAMEENPGTTIGAEVLSSFAIPVAGSRNAVARGGQAAVRQAARTGAAVGAVAGAGYGEGVAGTVGGAAVGAGLGAALGGQTEKFLRGRRLAGINSGRNNPPPTGGGGGAAIQAADNLNAQTGSNIRLLPADVAGPGVRNVTGGAAKMTISGELIGRASQRLTDEAEKVKTALVNLVGGRAEPEVAGERALEGARKWMKTSATKRDALYAKARKEGGDEPVDLVNARQVLDGHIAELSQTPGSAEGLARLQSLRAELGRPFPVEGVKRMRTRLRDDFGSDGLRSTDIERRVGQVIDAAENDIVTSLQAAGKANAARLYTQASKAHRERVEVIDNVLAPIIGARGDAPRSGEQIISAIELAGRSNSARLGEFMKTLPAEDAGLIRGTIIDRLGRATAGQQDETGAAFSLNTFLTNWSKMSDRAKGTMFSGESRAALNDLAKVASARRDSGRYVNFSNTGSVAGNLASGAALAGSVTNPATLGLFAIDGLTGVLLSSPRIARWLAKTPANPAAQRAHINGLSKIAAAEPAIAADALGLQQQLLSRFGPDRLAAEQGAGSDTTGSGTQ